MPAKNRFELDLDLLINKGEMLSLSMRLDCYGKDFENRVLQKMDKDKKTSYLKSLPDFKLDYQAWYSESLALITQLLPDRIRDFVSYYEYPRARKAISAENYMIRDYLQGLSVTRLGEEIVEGSSAIPEFDQQLSILKGVRSTLHSSLVDLKSILQADLFDTEIDSASALAKAGHLRPAGAICGVVIEKHLRQVCENRGLRIRKKHPAISDYNQTLRDNDTISVPQWRFVQHLADIRNICDHDRGREPRSEEIDDLLSGTSKVLKTIF